MVMMVDQNSAHPLAWFLAFSNPGGQGDKSTDGVPNRSILDRLKRLVLLIHVDTQSIDQSIAG